MNSSYFRLGTSKIGPGRCHTLIVTKISRKYEGECAQWLARLQQVRKTLQPLHNTFFKLLLGTEEYKQEVLLNPLPSPNIPLQPIDGNRGAAQGSASKSAVARTVPGTVTGKKRKHGVVDLCSGESGCRHSMEIQLGICGSSVSLCFGSPV